MNPWGEAFELERTGNDMAAAGERGGYSNFSQQVALWRAKARGLITRLSGQDSPELSRWDALASEHEYRGAFEKDASKAEQVAYLRAAVVLLTEFESAGLFPEVDLNGVPAEIAHASGSRVFIIHGHDHSNALRLKELLRDRFHVEPVILSDQPGQGRTIIEKFEQEAAGCGFAIALLTPDDQVVTPTGEFTQSRPNVVFELGWFYGRIGRDRVVILMKQGMQIHSDLGGIERYEFVSDVREQAFKIEDELKRVGIARA